MPVSPSALSAPKVPQPPPLHVSPQATPRVFQGPLVFDPRLLRTLTREDVNSSGLQRVPTTPPPASPPVVSPKLAVSSKKLSGSRGDGMTSPTSNKPTDDKKRAKKERQRRRKEHERLQRLKEQEDHRRRMMGMLKRVKINGQMFQDFMNVARTNTSRGIETCGLLCGKLVRWRFGVRAFDLAVISYFSFLCRLRSPGKRLGVPRYVSSHSKATWYRQHVPYH